MNTTEPAVMTIYGYEYLYNNKYNNATITVSVRTDKGKEEADRIAQNEFEEVFTTVPEQWWLGESWDEVY